MGSSPASGLQENMTEVGTESATVVYECRAAASQLFTALLNADGSVTPKDFLLGLRQAQNRLLKYGRVVRSEREFRSQYRNFSDKLNKDEAYVLPSIRMDMRDLSRLVPNGQLAREVIGQILDAPGRGIGV